MTAITVKQEAYSCSGSGRFRHTSSQEGSRGSAGNHLWTIREPISHTPQYHCVTVSRCHMSQCLCVTVSLCPSVRVVA